MPKFLQSNFNLGQITSEVRNRADLAISGLEVCSNLFPTKVGALKRRPGTRYISRADDQGFGSDNKPQLHNFIFNRNQAYVLSFGDKQTTKLAFFQDGVKLTQSLSDVEVDQNSWFAQSSDVLYVVGPNTPPFTIVRNANGTFSKHTLQFNNGPFLPRNRSQITMSFENVDVDAVPLMTSNTAPDGYIISSAVTSSAGAYNLFARNAGNATLVAPSTAQNPAITVTNADKTVTNTINNWAIRAPADSSKLKFMPSKFTLIGRRGSGASTQSITLDERVGETGWGAGEIRYYGFENELDFHTFEIQVSSPDDPTSEMWMGEIRLGKTPGDQTNATIRASASSLYASGNNAFAPDDVGSIVQITGVDNIVRYFRIKAVSAVNSLTAEGVFEGPVLIDTSPVTNWAMPAFNRISGYPQLVAFYKNRLVFASTEAEPEKLWMTSTGRFEFDNVYFDTNSPRQPTDAIEFNLIQAHNDRTIWISGSEDDVLLGDSSGIRAFGAADDDIGFSATNFDVKPGPSRGVQEGITPIRIDDMTLFIEAGGNSVYTLGWEGGRYRANEITLLADIFDSPVISWAYQARPDRTLWLALANGKLASIVIERRQQELILGYAIHDVGGVVEQVTSIPRSSANDEVWLQVVRTAGANRVRTVEVMVFEDVDDCAQTIYLDGAVAVEYAVGATITPIAMPHLAGEEAMMVVNGIAHQITVPANGNVLPNQSMISSTEPTCVIVGKQYDSVMVTMPFSLETQMGVALADPINISRVAVDVDNAAGVRVRGVGEERNTSYTYITEPIKNLIGQRKPTLESGWISKQTDGVWRGDGQIEVRISDPYPATIRSLITSIKIGDSG